VTAVPRSLASSISPTLAGALFSTAFSGLPLVICGGLKIIYDVALLVSFRHMKPPEERDVKAASIATWRRSSRITRSPFTRSIIGKLKRERASSAGRDG
jgi:hypothetical protein